MPTKRKILRPAGPERPAKSDQRHSAFPEPPPLQLGQLIFMTTTSLLEEYKDRLTENFPPPGSREAQRLVRELTSRFGKQAAYWRTSKGRPLSNLDRDLKMWNLRQCGLSYGKIGIKIGISSHAVSTALVRQERRFEKQEEQWKAICARMSLPYTPLFRGN